MTLDIHAPYTRTMTTDNYVLLFCLIIIIYCNTISTMHIACVLQVISRYTYLLSVNAGNASTYRYFLFMMNMIFF